MIAMLSFMPKNSDLNEILYRAGNALKERVNKRGYSGERRVLNVKVDSEIFNMLDDIQSEFGLNRLDAVMKAIRETHDAYFRKARSAGQSLGVKHDKINTNQIRQDSNSRKNNSSRRSPPWKNQSKPADNAIENTPNVSASLNSENENGSSAALPEVPQSHQPPTSAELPASDVVEDKEVDEAASPRPTALQTLVKNLG